MQHELEVEERAVPAYGEGVEDQGRAHDPDLVEGRGELEVGPALDDGEGDAPPGCEEGDDGRGGAEAELDGGRPEGDHGPGLVHEGRLEDDEEQQGGGVAGDAADQEAARDGGVVARPELVEVVEGREEEGEQQGHADDAGGEAGEVEGRREAAQLRGRRHDEHHDEQRRARAELEGVVDGHADRLVVVGVDAGDRDGDGALRRREERDGLEERVEGHVGGGRGVHDA